MVNAVSNSVVPKIAVIVAARLAPDTMPCAAKRSIRDLSLPGYGEICGDERGCCRRDAGGNQSEATGA